MVKLQERYHRYNIDLFFRSVISLCFYIICLFLFNKEYLIYCAQLLFLLKTPIIQKIISDIFIATVRKKCITCLYNTFVIENIVQNSL